MDGAQAKLDEWRKAQRTNSTSQATGSAPRNAVQRTTCQKCLKKGHLMHECPNKPAYKARPSATKLLKNPNLRKELTAEKLEDEEEEIAKRAKELVMAQYLMHKKQRGTKRKRREVDSSSSDSDSSSDSSSSDSSSDSSDSDSSSS